MFHLPAVPSLGKSYTGWIHVWQCPNLGPTWAWVLRILTDKSHVCSKWQPFPWHWWIGPNRTILSQGFLPVIFTVAKIRWPKTETNVCKHSKIGQFSPCKLWETNLKYTNSNLHWNGKYFPQESEWWDLLAFPVNCNFWQSSNIAFYKLSVVKFFSYYLSDAVSSYKITYQLSKLHIFACQQWSNMIY